MRRIHREENNNKKKVIIGVLALLSTTGGALVVNNMLFNDEQDNNKQPKQPEKKIETKVDNKKRNEDENKNNDVDMAVKTETPATVEFKTDKPVEKVEVKAVPQNSVQPVKPIIQSKPVDIIKESKIEVPKVNEPKVIVPEVVEEPKVELPKVEKPVEESKVVLPKTEVPKVEKPKIEEKSIKETVKPTENETSSISNENIVLTKEVIEEKPEVKVVESVKDVVVDEKKDVITYSEKVETVTLPYSTKITENKTLKKGETKVITKGATGTKEITTKITKVNGIVTKTEVINEVDSVKPVTEEIEVGTFEDTVIKVNKDEDILVDYTEEERYVNTLKKGDKRIVQKGEKGINVDTYSETYVNGELVDREKVNTTVKLKPKTEIVEIGTAFTEEKEEVVNEVIPFDTVFKNDDTLLAGKTQTESEGENGVKSITYTVTVNQDGEIVSKVVKNETTTPPKNKVILVGIKRVETLTERNVVEPKVVYKDTDELEYGTEEIESQGGNGYIINTIEVTYAGDSEIERRIVKTDNVASKDRVIKRGTKNISKSKTLVETIEEVIPFETKYESDDTKYSEEETEAQKGENGYRRGTRTTVINEDGTTTTTVDITEKLEPRNRIVVRGTISSVETIVEEEKTSDMPDKKIEYYDGISRNESGVILISGSEGKVINTVRITKYTTNGKSDKREILETKTVKAVAPIEKRPNITYKGTRDETRTIPKDIIYEDDSNIDFGTVVPDETRPGRDGVETRKVDDFTKMVLNERGEYVEVSYSEPKDWRRVTDPSPKYMKRGTRPVIETKETKIVKDIPYRTIYEKSIYYSDGPTITVNEDFTTNGSPGKFTENIVAKYVNGELTNVISRTPSTNTEETYAPTNKRVIIKHKLKLNFQINGPENTIKDYNNLRTALIEELSKNDKENKVAKFLESNAFIKDDVSTTKKSVLPHVLGDDVHKLVSTDNNFKGASVFSYSTVNTINYDKNNSETISVVEEYNNAWNDFVTNNKLKNKLLTTESLATAKPGDSNRTFYIDMLDNVLRNISNSSISGTELSYNTIKSIYKLVPSENQSGVQLSRNNGKSGRGRIEFLEYKLKEDPELDYGIIRYDLTNTIPTLSKIEYETLTIENTSLNEKLIFPTNYEPGTPLTIVYGTKGAQNISITNETERDYNINRNIQPVEVKVVIDKNKPDGYYYEWDEKTVSNPVPTESSLPLKHNSFKVDVYKTDKNVVYKEYIPNSNNDSTLSKIYHNVGKSVIEKEELDLDKKREKAYPVTIVYEDGPGRQEIESVYKYEAPVFKVYKYKTFKQIDGHWKELEEEIKRVPLVDEHNKQIYKTVEDENRTDVVTKVIKPLYRYDITTGGVEILEIKNKYIADPNIDFVEEKTYPKITNVRGQKVVKQKVNNETGNVIPEDQDGETELLYYIINEEKHETLKREITVGTRKTVISETVVFDTNKINTERVLDATILTEKVSQEGKSSKEKTKTTSYVIGKLANRTENGVVYYYVDFNNASEHIQKVETIVVDPGKSRVIAVPKYKITHTKKRNVIPFTEEIRYDNELEAGVERIDEPGENGYEDIIEYKVFEREDVNSDNYTLFTENTDAVNTLKEKYKEENKITPESKKSKNRIKRIGTKQVGRETVVIPKTNSEIPIKIIDDNTLEQSEPSNYIVISNGEVEKEVRVYETVNNQRTDNQIGETQIIPAKPKVVKRGTKPKYETKIQEIAIEPKEIRRENHLLQKGKTIRHNGTYGKITKKIKIGTVYGEEISKEIVDEVITEPAIDTIIEVGTFENTPFTETITDSDSIKEEYIYDDNMLVNDSVIIQQGRNGIKEVTYRYVLRNGIKTDEKEIVATNIIQNKQNTIIKKGTKRIEIDKTPTVREEIAQPKDEIRYNSNLEKGRQNVLDEGQPGYREIRYKKIYVNNKLISSEEYDSKIVQQPRKRIIEIGTKEKAVEKRTLIKREDYWNFFAPTDERNAWAKAVPETFEDIMKMDSERVFELSNIKKVGIQKYDKATLEYLYSQLDTEWINDEIIRMTNVYRKEQGLTELVSTIGLREPAQIRSDELALNGHIRFNNKKHTRKDGSPWHTVLDRSKFRAAGENLTMLYFGNPFQYISEKYIAHTFFQQWKNSPKHWENMMDRKAVGMYIAIQFGENSLFNNEPYNANSAIGTMLIDKTKRK